MRRRFVLAFVALFALLALGVGISLVFIWRGSKELRQVLTSHQVEDLRRRLSQALDRSQQDLQVSGTVFANQLDEIIANVQTLDRSIQGCFDCHHERDLRREMEQIAELLETYKHQYSTFITAFLNRERRQSLQFEAAATADEIERRVEAFLARAGPALQRRTEAATAQVERSWTSLVLTLLLTFVVAVLISSALTRSVTEPLGRLAKAAERVGGGDLGHRIEHRQRHELGVLMDAFNDMSRGLELKTEKIEGYVAKLHRLNENIVSMHSPSEDRGFFARQVKAIDSLLDVELRGSVLPTDLEDVFHVCLSPSGEEVPRYRAAISAAKMRRIRERSSGALLVVEGNEVDDWPFGPWAPPERLRNYLLCWVEWQGEPRGALLVANKIDHSVHDPLVWELLAAWPEGAARPG